MDAPLGRNDANPPALPGQGAVQPTPERKAAIEAGWFDLARLMQAVLEVLASQGKGAADSLLSWVRNRKGQ